MTSETVAVAVANRPTQFAPYHKWDRNFFLTCVVLIWFGILNGFVPEIIQHFAKNKPPYPLIIHVHAVAFVGWLVVLTIQTLLIRRGRHDLHKRLGFAAMGLASIMVVVGPATAFYMQRYHWGTPESDPAFLAVQLTDILAFAGLASAAFALRGDPSAHKRLIILATLYISDAGFARFLGDGVHAFAGDGFFPFMMEAYLANDLLVLGLGAYDLGTRKRLHPAYVAGVAWTAVLQLTATFLYRAPFFLPVAKHLIGH
jgi:uncharacterized membrane protein YozB (DUF420 family)